MGVGTMAATSGPLMLVKLFTGVFGSDDMGWFGMGVTYGVLIVVFYHICCLALRSQEPPNPNLTKGLAGEKISFASVLAGYKKAFSNRALVCLVVITFVVNVVVTYGASLQMYLLTYVYGYDEMKTSSIFFIQSVFVLAAVVVATFLAKKLGKKYAMIVGQIIYGVSFLWVLLFPVSYATMISSIALLAIGNSAYWTLIYSMTYDSTLIEQYKSGEVPSGLYVSMIGFFMKVGNSLGMFFSGLSLEYIGFQGDAAEQAASTVRGIRMMFGIVPAFVFVIGIIAGFKYALTKEKYDLLNNALQLKQQNRPHDVDGLRGIL
jgi:Na+/melibiose symporter-like transporter